MKRRIPALLVILTLLVTLFSTSIAASENIPVPQVNIVDKVSHYEVTANFNGSENHRLFGEEYGKAIKEALPEYEELLDTYLFRIVQFSALKFGVSEAYFFNKMIENANNILPQVDTEYRDEMEGLASEFTPDAPVVVGDGQISSGEIIAFNLLPDIVRVYECSAAAVFGERSATGGTIAARNLDWSDLGIISKFCSVTTINNQSKSICLVGYLGNLGAVSAFNGSGVFGSILDTSLTTAKPADSYLKRSYYMDLRHALENETTLQGVADYMKDTNKKYIYNHLIFLADKTDGKVLENNISGTGPNMRRDLRSWNSVLNEGITWGISNAIGCVNCFMLNGNHDDYTQVIYNTTRWESLKRELLAKGEKVDAQELQDVISYSHYDGPGLHTEGDLYWGNNMIGAAEGIIFIPATGELKAFFRPRDGILPAERTFETIQVSFLN